MYFYWKKRRTVWTRLKDRRKKMERKKRHPWPARVGRTWTIWNPWATPCTTVSPLVPAKAPTTFRDNSQQAAAWNGAEGERGARRERRLCLKTPPGAPVLTPGCCGLPAHSNKAGQCHGAAWDSAHPTQQTVLILHFCEYLYSCKYLGKIYL